MQFSSFLDDVVGSRVMVGVLRVLCAAPTKEFTGHEVANEAGLSASKTIDALHLLRRHGILERRRAGNAHLWKLRSGHVLSDLLGDLFAAERGARTTLARKLEKSLRAVGDVEEAFLFGSVARGDERPDSDVDLLVVAKSASACDRIEKEFHRTRDEVEGRFGNRVQLVLVPKSDISNARFRPLLEAARREGLTLIGGAA